MFRFLQDRQKLTCGRKSGYLTNKHRIDEKDFFSSNSRNWTDSAENCFASQNEPHTAFLSFSVVLMHFRLKLTKKHHFGPKRHHLRKKLGITLERLFSSNEFETCQIQSKIVSNFKISHIREFSFILMFCIIFVENAKNFHYVNNLIFDEIILFSSNTWKGTNININCFALQNEPHTANLSFSVVLKHFHWKLTKTPHWSWDSLRVKLRITLEGLFFLKREWNWSNPVDNYFELQISHFGLFSFILVFCIIFVRNHKKWPLCSKKWLLQK